MKKLRTLLLLVAVCALLLIGGCTGLPAFLEALNPGVTYRVPNAGRTLYLTIDDGPSEATAQILTVLHKHGVGATFFIVSDHIRPERMDAIRRDGHQVAHHMKTTASLGRLSPEQFQADFLAADAALAPFHAVKLFRPPGGSITKTQLAFVHAQGYETVVGTVFPLDHWIGRPRLIKLLAEALTTDGGIIVLHDTPTRGPTTATVLDQLIPELQQDGYRFALLPAGQDL